MSEHTPGPWKAVGRGIFADSVQVGTASHPRDGEDNPDYKYPASYDQSLANARLMASAPDLLDALQGLVGLVELVIPTQTDPQHSAVARNHRLVAARAAIALVRERRG
jgi:hypothetical protein